MGSSLRDLDDQRLIASVASRLGVPRASVPDHLHSFALHAPLELMARAALLPLVASSARDAARERLIVLAEGYDAAGPPADPPTVIDFDSVDAALDAVVEPTRSDAAAAWLGARLRVDELVGALAPAIVPSLDAAGHAGIYLSLLARYQPRGLPGQMLRHPVHALSGGTGARIEVLPRGDSMPVRDVLSALEPIGPPPSPFIAPMMLHSQSAGVFMTLTGPAPNPFELLRYAAQSMLQGSPQQAPYGWTHQMTLAQAPLLLAGHSLDDSTARFVAAAYLAAHWAAYGEGRVDLAYTPEPVELGLLDALRAGPIAAAAAAFHAGSGPAAGAVAAALATEASRNHDAHRVKYTLACLDAASCDRGAQPLYLAAAAYLNGWWIERGDDGDPRPDLV